MYIKETLTSLQLFELLGRHGIQPFVFKRLEALTPREGDCILVPLYSCCCCNAWLHAVDIYQFKQGDFGLVPRLQAKWSGRGNFPIRSANEQQRQQ